jgi:soluble lytic murein transglycosylase-like protein
VPSGAATLKHRFVICSFVVQALVGFVPPAQAQIYSWRDANGVLTVSDRPKDAGPRAVIVPVSPSPSTRSNPMFEPLIRQHATQHGLQPDLVRAVIQVESAFNPQAVSPKGAMGLMQLMPTTAAMFGVINPFNPAENIRAGVSYLRQLLERYDHNEQLALAAYNAGPNAVQRYGNKVPPYRETQQYVKRITGIRGTARYVPGARMYKVTQIVDGRAIVKYTNTRPETGDYVEVRR